jgi:hypothetical protein
MFDDPIAYGARLKIWRAEKHINELWRAVEKFMEKRPFRLIVKHRPKANEYLIVTKRYHKIPDPWSLMIGDVVHNLWSALDLAVYAMASDKAPDPHELMFPFVRKEKDLVGKIKSTQVEFAGTEVIEYIHALKPYRDGHKILSGIYRLDTRDKHRLLILTGQVLDFDQASLRAIIPGSPNTQFLKPGQHLRFPHPDEDEVQLFKGNADYSTFGSGDMTDREEEPYIRPPYRIAFGEGQPFEGHPVLTTLRDCVYVVEGIVDRLVAAFRSPSNIRP